jgi:hypothetical protein
MQLGTWIRNAFLHFRGATEAIHNISSDSESADSWVHFFLTLSAATSVRDHGTDLKQQMDSFLIKSYLKYISSPPGFEVCGQYGIH